MTWTTEQGERSAHIQNLLVQWDSGNPAWRGVYLWGAAGTGKTMIAEHWIKQAKGRGWYTFSGNALDLTLEAHASMNKHAKGARTPWEMGEEVGNCRMALIDDIGRERNEYGKDVVFNLFDKALRTDCFLILTGNKKQADLAAFYDGDDGFKSRLSALRAIEFPAAMMNWRKGKDDA